MMNTDHDELEDVYEEDEAPRSIFAAAWFRVVLVVLVLGVVGAIAIPYVLDAVNAPAATTARAPSPAPESAGARSVATLSEPAKPTPVPPPTPSTSTMRSPASPAAPKTAEPATPAPPAKAAEPAKTVEPPKRTERAKVAEATTGGAHANASAAAKPSVARGEQAAAASASTSSDAGSGDYFVQVGAFKDERMAKRVAAQLRKSNYPVSESVTRASVGASEPPRVAPRAAATPGDRYDVLVSGGPATEINTKLAAKGLASEPAGDGVRIRPSLPLRDAVALSKDLGNEGFRVQVRRGGPSGEPIASAPSIASESPALYRVRVGGYADRAAAQTVVRELRDKGYEPFIAKGRD